MKKYNEMELNVLYCLYMKPELMEEVILEDKHFIKFGRLWKFMKAFYEKYKTFDMNLMYSVCKEKRDLVDYFEMLVDVDAFTHNFQKYQEQLIELYNEGSKNKYIINKLTELNDKLLVRSVKVSEYKTLVDKIYNDAEEIFKNV